VNRELACFKHLFNVAKQRTQFFGDNPVSKVKFLEENNQIERVLTPEEEERLIANSAPHLKPIIQTAIYTGMRKNEMLSLKWNKVDLENNILTIEATNTKSKKLKRIPISSKLRKVLLEQKLKTGFNEYVFLNPEGEPYQRHDSLKRCFEGACRRAGIKGLRFHDLRHTAATRMVEKGANIVAIKRILGHADINTTMRYAHPDDSLGDAVEKLADFESTTDQFTDQQKT
jgi:integrase